MEEHALLNLNTRLASWILKRHLQGVYTTREKLIFEGISRVKLTVMGRSARQNGKKRTSVSGSGSLDEAFRNFQSFRSEYHVLIFSNSFTEYSFLL